MQAAVQFERYIASLWYRECSPIEDTIKHGVAVYGDNQVEVLFGELSNRREACAELFVVSLTIIRINNKVNAQLPREKVYLVSINRIKHEGFKHSQILEMIGYLTDVAWPRLTGSPNLKKAQEYTRDRLHKWGLLNAHL